MKRVTNSICATALLVGGSVGISSQAHAVAISYEGEISIPLGAVSGEVSGTGWANDDAVGTDFWSFEVGAGGAELDIWALRKTSELDTVFTIYLGTTTADESEFKHMSDFGGMTALFYMDDQIKPFPEGSMFGDPALYNTVFPEGTYTIAVGGFLSTDDGDYTYKLGINAPGTAPAGLGQDEGPEVVPLPTAAWLFGSAIIGLVGIGRRKLKS